jgi:RNA polymerase sigma-70 factor (ECF subfamily)
VSSGPQERYGNPSNGHSIIGGNLVSINAPPAAAGRPHLDRYPFDAEYLRRLREGDSVTTEHFVNYFTERLTLKLWKSRYDESDRQDIIQETFVRLLVKLRAEKGIQCAEKFGAYVFGVCDNVIRESIRPPRPDQLDDDCVDIPSLDLTAEQLWIRGEEAADVVQTLRLMRPADAELLVDVVVRKRPKDEICRQTGSTRGNLRVKLHRAIARFRFLHSKRKGMPPAGR